MEKKNLLHTERVNAKSKTVFMDLKVSEKGNNYVVITESRKVADNQYERNTMVLFQDELERFGEAFTRILMQFSKNERGASDEYIAEIRKTYPRAYESWAKADDELLEQLVESGAEPAVMVEQLQRAEGAIEARIRKLSRMKAEETTTTAA